MNKYKLHGDFVDFFFDKNYKKQFSELNKSEVKLLAWDQSSHIKFWFYFNRAVTVSIILFEIKTTLNAGEIKFY